MFGDHDQHAYTQQCDSTRSVCDWSRFLECNDADNTLVNIASQSDDGYWDSFCWNFDEEEWVEMWWDFDSGSADADRLEALYETSENQFGTISMGTVRFYGLELRDATTWHDWTTTYSSDTRRFQQGGYSVTTNSRYHDFEVEN